MKQEGLWVGFSTIEALSDFQQEQNTNLPFMSLKKKSPFTCKLFKTDCAFRGVYTAPLASGCYGNIKWYWELLFAVIRLFHQLFTAFYNGKRCGGGEGQFWKCIHRHSFHTCLQVITEKLKASRIYVFFRMPFFSRDIFARSQNPRDPPCTHRAAHIAQQRLRCN